MHCSTPMLKRGALLRNGPVSFTFERQPLPRYPFLTLSLIALVLYIGFPRRQMRPTFTFVIRLDNAYPGAGKGGLNPDYRGEGGVLFLARWGGAKYNLHHTASLALTTCTCLLFSCDLGSVSEERTLSKFRLVTFPICFVLTVTVNEWRDASHD